MSIFVEGEVKRLKPDEGRYDYYHHEKHGHAERYAIDLLSRIQVCPQEHCGKEGLNNQQGQHEEA